MLKTKLTKQNLKKIFHINKLEDKIIENMFLYFAKAPPYIRVKTPSNITAIIKTKYAVFRYGETDNDNKLTDFITSLRSAKKGTKKNKTALTSNSPNTTSRKRFCFCLLSFSAIFKSSPPDKSSSIVILKNADILNFCADILYCKF